MVRRSAATDADAIGYWSWFDDDLDDVVDVSEEAGVGNVIENIHDHIDLVGYVHAADVPGHREPGTGEINYPNVLQALADAGYDVGAEFVPMGAPETAIRKVRAMLAEIQ